MAETTSLNFPNMFNVTQGKVSVLEDAKSVTNRVKLLLLTRPTEIYNNPDVGIGIEQYLFTYNGANTFAIIADRIKEQLGKYEPQCDIENTRVSEGLKYSGNDISVEYNKLNMTVEVATKFGSKMSIPLNSDVDFIAFND